MPELPETRAQAQSADMFADGEAEPEAAAAAPAAAPRVRRLDFVGRRNLFFALSLLIIIPGIVSMATKGFALGIDFAGGTELTVNFADRPTVA
ncbi:MAG TPA: hypothetical protein VGR23_01160, partial [Candidatus Dormibacteraeota bacterium]|nr:hypothetical protein [Candidatus Dormibacteraeota bacterium]